ncbi:MAG TPA: glycosyltransferase family 4 protein, partial [bacterium]|nr:glycosyltransferase family 4 protein [bacterium]
MRLLYVNADPGIPFHGPKGASVHVRRITQALARRAESVEVVAARRGRPETGDGIRILVPESSSAPRPDASAAAVTREADALLRDEALASALDHRLARGDVDVIWERYSLWSTAAANAAARTGVPWVLEVNAPLAEEAARHRSLALPGLAGYLQRERWRSASAVFAVSRELAETIVRSGADPARVHVLPNGYDDRTFRRRPAAANGARSQAGPFTVAFVGSLKPWHGVDRLVDAFLRLRSVDADWRLLLIGDGPLAGPLRQRLEQSAPEGSFEITGAVPHDDVPRRLAAADVAVAPYPPSDDFYFSPLKVVEYAALGLPIVASRIGQIAELLENGRSALLTEPGDIDDLAGALRRLRDDGALRAALG